MLCRLKASKVNPTRIHAHMHTANVQRESSKETLVVYPWQPPSSWCFCFTEWAACLPACLSLYPSVCLSVCRDWHGSQSRKSRQDAEFRHGLWWNTPQPQGQHHSDSLPHGIPLLPLPQQCHTALSLRPFSCSPAPLVGLVDVVCRGWKISAYTDHMCAMRALLHQSFLFGCGVNARDRNVPHSSDAEWAVVCLSRQGISFKELVACDHATCVTLPLRYQSL